MAKRKQLTIEQAIAYINSLFGTDVDMYKKQTLYNAIHAKRIHNFGTRHRVLLATDELESVFGPKRAS